MLAALAILSLTGSSPAFSQVNVDSKYGGYFHYNRNYHNSDFGSLPGVPNCCPAFIDGTGSGFSLGIFYFHKFSDLLFSQLKLGYITLDAKFKSVEKIIVSLNGAGVDGEFEHRLDISLGMGLLEHLLTFKLKNLYLSAGITGGVTIVRDYSQVEVITKPDGLVTFLDEDGNNTGKFTRNEKSGQIQSITSFNAFFTTGVSYSLPLNQDFSLSLVPEVYYSYALTNVVKGRDWSANALRVGLSVIYNYVFEEEEVVDSAAAETNEEVVADNNEFYAIATEDIRGRGVLPFAAGHSAHVRVAGLSNNIELGETKFKVEEFQSLNMTPLLNYIFFDNNSASIPQRYILLDAERAEEFEPANLVNSSTLETYYHVLNIIGYRMKEDKDAVITVTGCNSDNGQERNNKELSFRRAKAVAEYLINTWQIEPARVKAEARNLPATPSRNNHPEGMEENRRVEIESSNPEILRPFISNDTLVITVPGKLRFYIDLRTRSTEYEWELQVFQGEKLLFSRTGNDKPPQCIEWELDKDRYKVPRGSGSVYYRFIAKDNENVIANLKEDIKFDVQNIETKRLNNLEDKKIDNYSLILYQYNSSNLTKENESIADFIKGNLTDRSTIYITGFTDEIGDGEYNMELSEKRARKLKEILSSNAFERGLGKEVQLHDNKLPEGRFYNRTVKVRVETPVN